MYRPTLKARDRTGAIVAVAAIHVALGFAFLHLGGKIDLVPDQVVLDVFDVNEPNVPPPEPPVVEQQREKEKPKEDEGAASPENIRSQASPVVAPEPKIEIPRPPPVTASPTPNQGAAATQGAAPIPGPGTGAGGSGTGTGSGGAGSGSGGGGAAAGSRPALVRGITNRDYPVAIQRSWPRGGRVFLRLRIEANGRPSKCDVMRSIGNSTIDQWTCRLVMDRATFRPATDDRGVPVAAWFGYIQGDTGRFDR